MISYLIKLVDNVKFSIKINYESSHEFFWKKAATAFLIGVTPLCRLFFWRRIIDRLCNISAGNPSWTRAFFFDIAGYLFLEILLKLSEQYSQYVNEMCSEYVCFHIENIMMDKMSRMDLSFYDSAEMGNKVRRVRENFGVIQNSAWQVLELAADSITILGSICILFDYSLYLGIIAIVCFCIRMYIEKKQADGLLNLRYAQTTDVRQKEYYTGIFFDSKVLMEMKTNHFCDYFLNKQEQFWKRIHNQNKKFNIIYNVRAALLGLFETGAEVGAFVYGIVKAIAGEMSIGSISYIAGAIKTMKDAGMSLAANINQFSADYIRLKELQEFIKIVPVSETCGNIVSDGRLEIVFSEVSFSYPGSERKVLDQCSFRIMPGEKIGLIGYNGAGKSTIIKLLLRFYEPQEGMILIDGRDIKEYNIYQLRKRIGVLFQDYVTYCLPFREIIALSDFKERFDNNRIKMACDHSGISEIVNRWEEKYDSVMGRFFADNGKELSGGQWQLVSLARVYFTRNDFYIFDEPSASLDPVSEDRIINYVYSLEKKNTLIIISHRLSNMMSADRLLVLKDGRIVEEGKHTELLKKEGIYAELFHIQAQRYQ